MSAEQFILKYEDLAEDCASIQPEARGTRKDLDEATVLSCLQAFAAIPAVELVGAEARLRLQHHERNIVVHRSGSTLYFTPIPELSHTPAVSTPEEIIIYLTGRVTGPEVGEPLPDVSTSEVVGQSAPKRAWFELPLGAQVALLAVLLSIASGLAYTHTSNPAPSGYNLITDTSRLDVLPQQYNGVYGGGDAQDALRIEISGTNAKIVGAPTPGAPVETLAEFSFRYGLRSGRVALLGSKGHILEFNPDGSLLFGDTSYTRIRGK